MTTTVPKHNIAVDQVIVSDDPNKTVALFPGKKEGEFFTKAYKRDKVWVLVSDPDYHGSGLIVFIDNATGLTVGNQVKITKVLPNVVFGQWHS